MIWKKYTIDTTVEAADIVASVLFDNGIVGVEIEDNQNLTKDEIKEMYVDIPLTQNDDGSSKVIFYVSTFEDERTLNDYVKDNKVSDKSIDISTIKSTDNLFLEKDFEALLSKIKLDLESYEGFVDMGSLHISFSTIDDKSFIENWVQNFKPINIGKVSIIPCFNSNSNNSNDENDQINIYIEPGSAFGTGQHATTKLCIDSIIKISDRKGFNKGSFLDIGTGSGILSILAYKLSYKHIYAIDADRNVETNLLENFKLNSIDPNRLTYSFGNIIEDKSYRDKISSQKYDIIVVNILAPVIILMLEKARISELLAENGVLILSGITLEHENAVKNAINNGLKVIDRSVEGDWVSIVAGR